MDTLVTSDFKVGQVVKFGQTWGTVTHVSPHGSFVVLKISQKIFVCASSNNKNNWDESEGIEPFKAFKAYIGINYQEESDRVVQWILQKGGTIEEGIYTGNYLRKPRRVQGFHYEMKVSGLSPDDLIALAVSTNGLEIQ